MLTTMAVSGPASDNPTAKEIHPVSEPQPPDAPLTRTTRSRSWLVPTMAVVVVLVTVVVVGRLGQVSTPPGATPAPSAAAFRPTVRPVGPRASLTVVRRPVYPSAAGLIGAPIGIQFEGERYDDGVPAVFEGDPVIRVRDAATLAVGYVALVGGWARRAPCPSGEGANPCLALLSDVPFGSPRVAELALGGQAAFDYRSGPRVFRATVQADPSCTFSAFDACLPRLIVGRPLWEGDEQTSTAPLAVPALLGDLASRFPTLDFQPFEEATSCPVVWPVQSYLVSQRDVSRAESPSLPVHLVVVFPGPDDLAAQAPAMRQAAARMTSFEASNRCVAVPGGIDDDGSLVRDNVMVLLGSADDDVRAQVNAALDGALATT